MNTGLASCSNAKFQTCGQKNFVPLRLTLRSYNIENPVNSYCFLYLVNVENDFKALALGKKNTQDITLRSERRI